MVKFMAEEFRRMAEHKREIENFKVRATLLTNLQQGGLKLAETVVADSFGAPLQTWQLNLK